jgi:ABC-2 type transport system permease protein
VVFSFEFCSSIGRQLIWFSTTVDSYPVQVSANPMSMSEPPNPPIETPLSAVVSERPVFARVVGIIGLFLLTMGIVVVIAAKAVGSRWVPAGAGVFCAAFGLVMVLYHAMTDGNRVIRRGYGGLTVFLLLFAVCMSILPGPIKLGSDFRIGYFLLPWGVSAWLLALLFSIPVYRHETDEPYRKIAAVALLSVGGILAIGSVAAGIFKPVFLVGPGITLALLGLGFLCAYLAQTDTSEGIGYAIACTLGAIGTATLFYAIARTTFPILLHDGPNSLRKPDGSLDKWLVLLRLLAGVAFGIPALISFLTRARLWFKVTFSLVALSGIGVVITSLSSNHVSMPPAPFLMPGGLILIGIGVVYLAASLAICSDSQFVTLTRRELSSYFLSPMVYLVLGGMMVIQWNCYRLFIDRLMQVSRGPIPLPIPEPIFEHFHHFALFPVLALLLGIPALSMKVLAEEKRSGSLEVLLTSPVNEWAVVLGKFLAAWVFFMLAWLPIALFLIPFRVETGVAFDYRPLLGFYVCLAAQGLGFVGMGLFFSTLTKNQIGAAVLTFLGMLFFLLCYLISGETNSFGIPAFIETTVGIPASLQTAVGRLSFLHMWDEALAGRLPIRDVLLYSSLGVFWLFLAVKVLEVRKWN